MADEESSSNGMMESMKKKIGPLPIWVWAFVGVAVLLFLRSRSKSTAVPADPKQTISSSQIPQFVNQNYEQWTPPAQPQVPPHGPPPKPGPKPGPKPKPGPPGKKPTPNQYTLNFWRLQHFLQPLSDGEYRKEYGNGQPLETAKQRAYINGRWNTDPKPVKHHPRPPYRKP